MSDFPWKIKIIDKNDHAVRLKISEDNKFLSFRKVFDLWQENTNFTKFYVDEIKQIGFTEFFWEHPPINKLTLDQPYEFILQKSKSFARRTVNETAFADYLTTDNSVAVFDNLGKNARLVVPAKRADAEIYKHFGSFLFAADISQIAELFNKIGAEILSEVKKGKRIWLNTAGMGVIWLHVRLDTTPKYYKTKTYRDIDFVKSGES